jgi:hypothetical protein
MPCRREQGKGLTKLKLIALGYVIKTILLGIAWLIVPDLPQRAATKARETWTAVSARF